MPLLQFDITQITREIAVKPAQTLAEIVHVVRFVEESMKSQANLTQGASRSLWHETVPRKAYEKLDQDIEVDICVIGGGIGGLTTAYLLSLEDKKVCLIEAAEIGSGQTGRSTAHFTNALDDRYHNIARLHGDRGAYLAAESHWAALNKVHEIVDKEQISCDFKFVDAYLFSAAGSSLEEIYKEHAAVHKIGLSEVNLVEEAPIKSFSTGPALHFPKQIKLHPLKYIYGLADCLIHRGGQIYTRTPAQEVKGGDNAFVKTRDGTIIRAKSIVVATNTPINDLFAIHTKQAPYRTYVIALKIPKGIIKDALYWDTLDPYHYFRVDSLSEEDPEFLTHDLLILGGEDHKTGQNNDPQDCFTRLEKWARSRFPDLKEVLYSWSGQVMEPVDGLAYLGHNPMDKNNVYVITGDSGNGMTHCTIGAMLITDQIMNRENFWEKLYSPSRISLRASADYLSENINVALQMTEWLTAKPLTELENLGREEGDVFRKGMQIYAAYKNEYGRIELQSAVCPHLGGVVRWNKVEKSWDCPCHGSRFDCHGKVIEGPAISNLKTIEDIDPHDYKTLNVEVEPEDLLDQPGELIRPTDLMT